MAQKPGRGRHLGEESWVNIIGQASPMKAFARASFGITDPIIDGGHSVYGDRDVAWYYVNMDEELRKLNGASRGMLLVLPWQSVGRATEHDSCACCRPRCLTTHHPEPSPLTHALHSPSTRSHKAPNTQPHPSFHKQPYPYPFTPLLDNRPPAIQAQPCDGPAQPALTFCVCVRQASRVLMCG